MGGRDPARPAAGAGDPRPRRLQADQRLARPRGRRPAPPRRRRRRSRPTCAAPTGHSGSVATSSRSSCPAPTRSGAMLAVRRLLAACLDGEVDARRPTAVSFSAGVSADPGPRARPRLALRPGRRGPVLGQAPRPDVRDDLRPRAPRRRRRHAPAGRAVRAGRPGRGDRRDPRGLPADLRPDDRCPARVRGSRPAAARQRLQPTRVDVRGGRGDRPDGRARPRLPQHRDGDGRPAAAAGLADDQPLAADDGDRRLQRPRPAADDRSGTASTRATSSSS